MKSIAVMLVLLAAATPCAAQQLDRSTRDALRWNTADRRVVADVVSTELVVVAIAAPCLSPETNRPACWRTQGLRVGLAAAAAEVAKRVAPRTRPNARDRKSFFSQHTAITCAASVGSRWWPLCPAVGYLRLASDWHWLTDVLVGAAAGLVTVSIRWGQ
jgi:membrane-associated phospholipid phosphatase